MSQEAIRELLQEMDNEASTSEIATRAKEKYPNRTLHTYVGQLLRRLEEKGFVRSRGDLWELTDYGKTTSIEGIPISDIDIACSEDDLNDSELTVANIVATIEIDRELDLYTLSNALSQSEYHPESSPFMIYRPFESTSTTLLVPTNGVISIVGAKSKSNLLEGLQQFFDRLDELGIEIEPLPEEALVQNIVVSGDFGVELELNTVVLELGFERTEYEPEQFPGIIYRMEGGSTALIFRTGKFLVNGAKSFTEARDSAHSVRNTLENIGVEFT
jgi:transcription initiation factor TFIID TATA-box-binding protein